jgi:hypothetical protein
MIFFVLLSGMSGFFGGGRVCFVHAETPFSPDCWGYVEKNL